MTRQKSNESERTALPLLSARIRMVTYWIATTSNIDQKIRLTTPRTCIRSIAILAAPAKVSRNA